MDEEVRLWTTVFFKIASSALAQNSSSEDEIENLCDDPKINYFTILVEPRNHLPFNTSFQIKPANNFKTENLQKILSDVASIFNSRQSKDKDLKVTLELPKLPSTYQISEISFSIKDIPSFGSHLGKGINSLLFQTDMIEKHAIEVLHNVKKLLHQIYLTKQEEKTYLECVINGQPSMETFSCDASKGFVSIGQLTLSANSENYIPRGNASFKSITSKLDFIGSRLYPMRGSDMRLRAAVAFVRFENSDNTKDPMLTVWSFDEMGQPALRNHEREDNSINEFIEHFFEQMISSGIEPKSLPGNNEVTPSSSFTLRFNSSFKGSRTDFDIATVILSQEKMSSENHEGKNHAGHCDDLWTHQPALWLLKIVFGIDLRKLKRVRKHSIDVVIREISKCFSSVLLHAESSDFKTKCLHIVKANSVYNFEKNIAKLTEVFMEQRHIIKFQSDKSSKRQNSFSDFDTLKSNAAYSNNGMSTAQPFFSLTNPYPATDCQESNKFIGQNARMVSNGNLLARANNDSPVTKIGNVNLLSKASPLRKASPVNKASLLGKASSLSKANQLNKTNYSSEASGITMECHSSSSTAQGIDILSNMASLNSNHSASSRNPGTTGLAKSDTKKRKPALKRQSPKSRAGFFGNENTLRRHPNTVFYRGRIGSNSTAHGTVLPRMSQIKINDDPRMHANATALHSCNEMPIATSGNFNNNVCIGVGSAAQKTHSFTAGSIAKDTMSSRKSSLQECNLYAVKGNGNNNTEMMAQKEASSIKHSKVDYAKTNKIALPQTNAGNNGIVKRSQEPGTYKSSKKVKYSQHGNTTGINTVASNISTWNQPKTKPGALFSAPSETSCYNGTVLSRPYDATMQNHTLWKDTARASCNSVQQGLLKTCMSTGNQTVSSKIGNLKLETLPLVTSSSRMALLENTSCMSKSKHNDLTVETAVRKQSYADANRGKLLSKTNGIDHECSSLDDKKKTNDLQLDHSREMKLPVASPSGDYCFRNTEFGSCDELCKYVEDDNEEFYKLLISQENRTAHVESNETSYNGQSLLKEGSASKQEVRTGSEKVLKGSYCNESMIISPSKSGFDARSYGTNMDYTTSSQERLNYNIINCDDGQRVRKSKHYPLVDTSVRISEKEVDNLVTSVFGASCAPLKKADYDMKVLKEQKRLENLILSGEKESSNSSENKAKVTGTSSLDNPRIDPTTDYNGPKTQTEQDAKLDNDLLMDFELDEPWDDDSKPLENKAVSDSAIVLLPEVQEAPNNFDDVFACLARFTSENFV
eukprot:gene20382-22391_t